MEKQNKYLELRDKIKNLAKDKELDEKSRELLEKTIILMEMDKLIKLSEYAIKESDTAKLLSIVKQNIEGYKISLDNLIDGEHNVIYFNEYMEIKNKLSKLSELKEQLEEHGSSQIQPFIDKYEELLFDYYESLFGSSNSSLLIELSKHKSEENVYETLESRKFYVDLKRCINFKREKSKNIKIIELCDDIFSYRNVLRENIDKLVEYNQLCSELTSSVGIKSMEEIKALKEKQVECNKKLLSSGLSNLLLGLNTNLKLALSKSNTPLRLYLQDVRSYEDLITYFQEVKDIRDRITKYMGRTFVFEEKYLSNTVNPIALEITDEDLVNARTLINLAEEDGSPSLKTTLVELLLAMEETSILDMDVSEKEFTDIKKHFNKKMDVQSQELFDKYIEIIENDIKSTSKSKEKTK